jgi:glutaredoxin-like protein
VQFIPEKDRQYLRNEFSKLKNPVRIILFKRESGCESCPNTLKLMEETTSLSEGIDLLIYDLDKDIEPANAYGVDRVPGVIVEGEKNYGIRFLGIPAGYEFSSLVEDIIDVGRGETSLSQTTKDKLSGLREPLHIQVFVTAACPYCPKAVRIGHMMAMESDKITADMVMANEFPQLSNSYGVMAVPKIIVNGSPIFEGALPEQEFVSRILEEKV